MGKSKIFEISATEPQDKDVIWVQPTTEIPLLDETKVRKIIQKEMETYTEIFQKYTTFKNIGTTIKEVSSNGIGIEWFKDNWNGIQNFKITPTSTDFSISVFGIAPKDLLIEGEKPVISGIIIIDNTSGVMKRFSTDSRWIYLNDFNIENKLMVFSYFTDGYKLYISKAN